MCPLNNRLHCSITKGLKYIVDGQKPVYNLCPLVECSIDICVTYFDKWKVIHRFHPGSQGGRHTRKTWDSIYPLSYTVAGH